MVQDGLFREDLFHRLNVIRVHLPKLSDRREDIPRLLHHFLAAAAEELKVECKTVGSEVETYLMSLNWPGNVSVSTNGIVAVTDTENNRILLWISEVLFVD